MIIPPGAAHPLRIPVVRYDVGVVRKLFVTDCAYSVLFADFPLQKLPHLSGGPEFPIPPRMMRIINAPNPWL